MKDFRKMKNIFKQFQFDGIFEKIESFEKGNINDTYKLNFSNQVYFLQKINTNVFKNPKYLLENTENVLNYIHQKLFDLGLDMTRRALTIIRTKNNTSYYESETGEIWRAFLWIPNAHSFAFPESPLQAYQAGKALADFHFLLKEYPTETLHETLPDFHNTQKRYQKFLAILEKDSFDRAKNVQSEIVFFQNRVNEMSIITDLLAKGDLPIRVTHNDPKLDNVLLDKETGKALCLIDLDTVMLGTIFYDYGDLIRTCAVTASENETNLNIVNLDLELFTVCTQGYLSVVHSYLTKSEKENLFMSVKLITLEQGLRFLSDYLDGDIYYRINHSFHNLVRSQNQIKLIQSIEDSEMEMKKIIAEFL